MLLVLHYLPLRIQSTLFRNLGGAEKQPGKNEALVFNVGFSKPRCVWLETPGIKTAHGCHSAKVLSRSVSIFQNLFFSRALFRTFYS